MKIKRLLSTLICLILVIGLIPVMSLTASAAMTACVGDVITLPESNVENSYGPAIDEYSISDETVAEFVGSNQIRFLKTGTVTVSGKYKLWDGQNPRPLTGTFYNETYTVTYPAPIQDLTIKLDSGAFSGGKEFPAFSVPNDSNYYVEEATFYKEMVDYYVGDTLPSYRAGTTISNVIVTLKPKNGYAFAFAGSHDEKFYESAIYTVEYKGKTYKPYVRNDYVKNEMLVYLDVTFEEGEIYATTIRDLDAPYHYGPLDKSVTTHDDVELVSVKYTMFGKELDHYEKGDTVGITVRLKSKDTKNTFNENGYAYWLEQKLNSTSTKLISDTEVEYTFTYKVDALPEQVINFVSFAIEPPIIGATPATIANSYHAGIIPGTLEWTPADSKFKDGEYTAKIKFTKEDEFVFCDDFENKGLVFINGELAEIIVEETESEGIKDKFKAINYYAQITMKAYGSGLSITTTDESCIARPYIGPDDLDKEVMLYMAFFDSNGRMIKTAYAEKINTSNPPTVARLLTDDTAYCTAMLWNKKTGEPLCNSAQITILNS